MIDAGTSPRILITRLSALGDCIHTLPLVSALRERFPQAYIAWVTQSSNGRMLVGHPGLDDVISVDRNWMRSWKSVVTTRDRLQSYCFDITIDPQSLTKSSLLGWLSGAAHRVGFTRGQGRELGPLLSTIRVSPQAAHVVDRYLELLLPLGINSPAVRFALPQRDAELARIRAHLRTERLRDFALLNPGAGWDSKLWPAENYAMVARHLRSTHELPSIVLWAGDRERRWAEHIVATSDGAAKLAPDTTICELASLCGLSRLFVGSDTGPLHMAAAVGTPTVAMYGPTRITECGPYGQGHQALQAYYQDGTSRQRRGSDNSAMRAISSDVVNAACDRILRGVSSASVA